MLQSLVVFCTMTSHCEGCQRSSTQHLWRVGKIWWSYFLAFVDQSSWNFEIWSRRPWWFPPDCQYCILSKDISH